MRFLLDQNLSHQLAQLLADAGHDAVHARTLGLSTAPDAVILDRAADESRVLVSADTDFGALLATGHRREPSPILFRRERPRRAHPQAALLLSHLDRVADALDNGAIVVIEERRIRVRALPVIPTGIEQPARDPHLGNRTSRTGDQPTCGLTCKNVPDDSGQFRSFLVVSQPNRGPTARAKSWEPMAWWKPSNLS